MIRHISLLLILGWMWTSTVSANPCEGTNKTFVPHADCTKYYTCVNGVAHEMNCPDEYPIFEPNGPICVPGDPNACIECPPEGVHRFPVPNSCEKFILCVNGVRSQNECRNGLQFDPITQQCNLPTVVGCVNVECSATDNPANPEFIPHPSDCQVYFICVAGVPIRQECPDGTAFDTKNKVCDKEENVTCPLAMVNFPFPHYSKASLTDEKCAGNLGIKYIPDSEDCMYYYMCMNDKAIRTSCETGLIFDEKSLKCGTPESAICIRSKTGESNPCEGNTGLSYAPHPNDCDKYYLCMAEMKYEVSCPDDLIFDSNSKKCQTRSNSTCYSQQTISKDIESPCAGIQGTTNIAHKSDCSQYYMCMSGAEYSLTCPEGNLFDITTSRCQIASEATCYSQPSDTTTISTLSTTTPSSTTIKDATTAATTIVATTTGATTTVATTTTGDTSTVATTTDSQHIPEAPTPSPATSPIPTAPTPGPSTVTLVPSTIIPPVSTTAPTNPPGLFCSPDAVYYRPHPICSKFYRCVYGKVYVLDCPQNQHWNQAREYCDHIWNVNCASQ